MSEKEKVPYITRIENQRDSLIEALKTVEAYHAAEERIKQTAYKSDARKVADLAYKAMRHAIEKAKNQLGGLYV